MELVRWNPWHNMMTFRNRMNRMLDESFWPLSRSEEDLGLSSFHPAIDVYEEDDAYVVKAELPGIDKKDITLDLKDRVLTLKGERSHENEVKEDKYYRRERSYGKFCRAFTLPAQVDPEKIKAEFKDGVLNISIPKPEENKPKQITVH